MQTDIEKYEYSNAFLANTDTHRGKGTDIIIDYHKDLFKIVSLSAIGFFALIIASLFFQIPGFFAILPILIGYAVLLYQEKTKVEFTPNSINIQRPLFTIINHYSILDFFIIFAYYLALLPVVLQNRTTVELTDSTIIIHRPFLRSIVIQKNEVIKTQIIKNGSHTTRWILRIVELIILVFLATHNINAIYINIEQSLPMLVTLVNIFSMPLITVMVAVLFYNNEIRMHYQASLHVATSKMRQFNFYVDNPDEFSVRLQHIGEVTLDG